MRKSRAFTLVELLVVIGIIAVLVGVLLPALSAARRQAATIKCAAQLREVGNALRFYEADSKGYYPVAQYGGTYTIGNDTFPIAGTNAYWINFIAKYVTKAKVGVTSTTVTDTESSRKSVLWGCSEWEGYATTALGGYNRVQNGYGFNPYPTFRSNNYVNTFPPNNERALGGTMLSPAGNFQKASLYRPATETCLVADSRFWLVESNPPPATGPYPAAVVAQSDVNNAVTYSGPQAANQTLIDIYRHGKRPRQIGSNTVDPNGGKIAFNVLYADGHVATATTGSVAYSAVRKKFPG